MSIIFSPSEHKEKVQDFFTELFSSYKNLPQDKKTSKIIHNITKDYGQEFWTKVSNPNESFYLDLLYHDPCLFEFFQIKTTKIITEALKINGTNIQFLPLQTEEFCIKAVISNPFALMLIKHQTESICLAAVSVSKSKREYSYKYFCLAMEPIENSILYYVKHQTEKICIEAVKNNGLELKYVQFPSLAICIEAVIENIESISIIRELFPEYLTDVIRIINNRSSKKLFYQSY